MTSATRSPIIALLLGVLLLTAFVLWIAARAVRRMQISYGSET